jgi:acetyltransferase-like isoleucine patch superfamily enzyme
MSKHPNLEQLETDRQQVHQWLHGEKRTPLVLPWRETYPPRDVLWPTFLSKVRQNWRSFWVLLANSLPISPLKTAIYRLLGMKIGRGVYIAPSVLIDPLYPELITLEDGSFLGIGCRLLTHEVTVNNFRVGRVVIGSGSVIGGYATVRSGVSIGKKVTVGLGSFVNRDVKDGLTVVGTPAREIAPMATGSEK